MWEAVEKLDFERAAALRDMIAGDRGQEWKPETHGRKPAGAKKRFPKKSRRPGTGK